MFFVPPQSTPEPEEKEGPNLDELKHIAWALEVLTRAGCDPEHAGRLVAYRIDHWKAKDLAEAGCDWLTIERILV